MNDAQHDALKRAGKSALTDNGEFEKAHHDYIAAGGTDFLRDYRRFERRKTLWFATWCLGVVLFEAFISVGIVYLVTP